MPDIKFYYLYRNSANFKNFGSVIIDNPDELSLEEAELKIKEKLIDGEWFYAEQWGFPDLRFADIDLDNDANWHEFERIEFTEEGSTHRFF